MIDPSKACLFIPPGLRGFKERLFNRIGDKVGRVIRYSYDELARLPDDLIPVVGCSPPLRPLYADWIARGRDFIYWDRGYMRRVFATWLPRGEDGGYYRWHVNAFQMNHIRDVPADRWHRLNIENEVRPWNKNGKHIIVADTLPDYWNVRGLPVDWSHQTAEMLTNYTDRLIIVRDKETKVPLWEELKDAHCLVAHGSIAAVESVIMGCPVFVDKESAASHMGKTDFTDIENPVYPDREKWLHSMAYCQFNEKELVDGTLWRLIE